ncbi:hypothetical protein C8J56DRAFT_769503, partial [Mycena floridula]
QILAFTGDNATSNDTQTQCLSDNENNSFDIDNRVWCFNHMLNLAVKSLLHPFQRPVRKDGSEIVLDVTDFDIPELEDVSDDDEALLGGLDDDKDDEDQGFDELELISETERTMALGEMDVVKETINKVR